MNAKEFVKEMDRVGEAIEGLEGDRELCLKNRPSISSNTLRYMGKVNSSVNQHSGNLKISCLESGKPEQLFEMCPSDAVRWGEWLIGTFAGFHSKASKDSENNSDD